jgi:acyl-homoserine-lactone acylase
VQNTNDPPWTATYPVVLDPKRFPSYVAGRDYSFRTRRSIHMLNENGHMTFDQLVTDKLSTRLELADRVLDDLLTAAGSQGSERARAADAVLKAWNRDAENDSRGTLLFEAWAKRFLAAPGFAVPSAWNDPLTTPRGLKDPASAVHMLEEAAAEVEQIYGTLDPPWGDFMRLRRGSTDLPANGAGGVLGAFRVLQYGRAQGNRKEALFGDTFVACVEFSNPPHAEVLVSYGNSSQPGSPHSEDQLSFLSQKKLRDAWRTRKEVEENLESKDVF